MYGSVAGLYRSSIGLRALEINVWLDAVSRDIQDEFISEALNFCVSFAAYR